MIIKEWLFPWESNIMIEHPLAMPVFMVIASFLLSIITWMRQRGSRNRND
ncbi:hypothetical protein ACFYKT_12440 [Cytobacillus sp. FJAT-53684]|uniref:Uncharacterized protein n=1 Tax=Cytobacillus mangrovibacter TaxID=3299024 RepID=A0ABW6JZ45_9BACI